jgi:hypothetical protein
MAKYAEVSYTGNGATINFVVSFPYIEKSHIKVYLDDVLTSAYTWDDGTTIVMNSAPANGVIVTIVRESSISTRLTNYNDGSKLVEADLNDDSEQALYLIQETRDLIEDNSQISTTIDARVTQNESDIATNTSDIATNTANIATNTSDISDNSIAIAANTSNIANNDIDIAANTAAIVSNDIEIAQNISDISDLDIRVTQNEADIAANTSAITSGDTATLVAAKAYADAVSGENLSPWASAVLYEVDDVCEYLNVIYQCITSHTSSGTFDGTKFEIISRVLSDAEVKVAYENNADTNALTDTLLSKLNAIEASATADQTGAEIKALYEAESNTNAFTDSEQSKLTGIESGATGDQTGAEIKALYEAESNTNAFTDAEKSKLAGIEDGATAGGSGGGLDAWTDATVYSLGNVVHYTDLKIYKCTTAHTSSGTLDVTKFTELSEGSTLSASDIKTMYESNSDTNAFTNADNAKLVGIEDSATADMTASEIKIAYESNSDTNAFTDAKSTKLDGIEANAIATYTNGTAMPEAVGGIEAGTTFSAATITSILTDLLYPYQYPYFNYFRVNGSSSVSLEVGATFSGTGLVFTWDIANPSNINTNSVTLNGTGSLANDGTETQTLSDQTETTATSSTYNISAVNSLSETISDTISVSWRYKRYWGVSASTSLDDTALLALGGDELSTNHTKSITYDGTGGRYFYFAFPQSFGALTATTINALSWNDWVLETRSVINAEGVSIPYYIYRSYNLINGTITVDWS